MNAFVYFSVENCLCEPACVYFSMETACVSLLASGVDVLFLMSR